MTIIGNTSIISISPVVIVLPPAVCPQCDFEVTAEGACPCGYCEESTANAARREVASS